MKQARISKRLLLLLLAVLLAFPLPTAVLAEELPVSMEEPAGEMEGEPEEAPSEEPAEEPTETPTVPPPESPSEEPDAEPDVMQPMAGTGDGSSAANAVRTEQELLDALLGPLTTIYLSANFNGGAALTTELNIPRTVTLKGAGQSDTVLFAGAGKRHFYVTNDADTITFEDIAFKGAAIPDGAGPNGGVQRGSLVFTRCSLLDNVNNYSGGYGGAVYTSQNVSMTDCTVSNNSAAHGGGVSADGAVDMIRCTFANNIATTGNGGGVFAHEGMYTNCTFVDNTAGGNGGGISSSNNVTLTNCTLIGNDAGASGGGFYCSSTNVNIYGSIIAGNTAAMAGDAYVDADLGSPGFTGSPDYNIIGYAGAVTETALFGGAPALGSNGGSTQTVLLALSGPAVGAIVRSGLLWAIPTTDQRGITRNVATNATIGAVEPSAVVSLVVTNTNDAGTGSLRDAIATANGNGGGTITFDSAIDGMPIQLETNLPNVSTPIVIRGNGANNIIGIPGLKTLSDLQTIMQAETLSIGGNDYVMGQLGSNGGATQTVMLSPGSPALDNIPTATFGGWPASPTTDQRGKARPDTSDVTVVDIGAVEAQQVVSIAIPSPPAQLHVAQAATLAYTTVPASPEAFGGVVWSSSNPSVLAVDPATGVLTAKTPGSAVIMATTANGKAASCTIAVYQPVASIAINEGPQALAIGSSFTYTATVSPTGYSTTNPVTWQSSNPTVATIDTDGKINAVSTGTTEITASIVDAYNDQKTVVSAPVTVTVSTSVVPVTGVTLNVNNATVAAGSTVQLNATVTPDSATNKALTWASSDESIATVDSNGLVKGVQAGVATITVRTADGSHAATCTVTVTAVATASGTSPPTGDSTNLNFWIMLALCSFIMICICLRKWHDASKIKIQR